MQKTWWETTRRAAWILPLVAFVGMTLIVFRSLHPSAGTPTGARLAFSLFWGFFLGFFGLIAALIIGTVRWAMQRHSVPAYSPQTVMPWQPPQPTWQPQPPQAMQPPAYRPPALPLSPAAAQVAQRARDAVARQTARREAQAAQPPAPLAPLRPPPVRPTPAVVDLADPERLNDILSELDGMPGLGHVSEQIRGMARRVALDQQRRAAGLKVAKTGLHAVFAGPPGTGKTSVARYWGRMLAANGLLPSGHLIECGRSDLVGEHVGSTAIKTDAVIDRAMGGVMFLDEAYALTPSGGGGGGPDFGQEALTTLLARMENDRGRFALIVAGYDREMATFLGSNPGLASRFSHRIDFPHYDAPALVEIVTSMAAASDYRWDDEALTLLRARLVRLAAAPPHGWANARSARSLLDAAVSAQADRLDRATGPHDREALTLLTAADVAAALARRYPEAD